MVNKGSHFEDFVRFRPHTYSLHAHSTISAALMGGNNHSLYRWHLLCDFFITSLFMKRLRKYADREFYKKKFVYKKNVEKSQNERVV